MHTQQIAMARVTAPAPALPTDTCTPAGVAAEAEITTDSFSDLVSAMPPPLFIFPLVALFTSLPPLLLLGRTHPGLQMTSCMGQFLLSFSLSLPPVRCAAAGGARPQHLFMGLLEPASSSSLENDLRSGNSARRGGHWG